MTPNLPPAGDPGSLRLAVIGDCPTAEDNSYRRCARGHGYPGSQWLNGQRVESNHCPQCGSGEWVNAPRPFAGAGGRMLAFLLGDGGLSMDRCFLGYVCQYPARVADLARQDFGGVLEGSSHLAAELKAWRPHAVLLLGNVALQVFHPQGYTTNEKRQACIKVGDWRGSVFMGRPELPWKCVAAYDPDDCIRQPEMMPLLRFDVKRAVGEARDPALNRYERELWVPQEVV